MMLKYNICFIRKGNRILLLNREKPSWMGCWNGIGGKLEEGEQPRASMLREIMEETQLEPTELTFKGFVTWSSSDGTGFGGMYVYVAEMPEEYNYPTPLKTDEGILDWKDIEWILHPSNQGVSSNIPPCLEKILYDDRCYNHHSFFHEGRFIDLISTLADLQFEHNEHLRNQYLRQYAEEGAGIRM